MDATTETFERDVVERSRELPVVVDFWAAWCGPCRTLGPAIEGEVAKRTGKLELVKIDIDAEPALAARSSATPASSSPNANSSRRCGGRSPRRRRTTSASTWRRSAASSNLVPQDLATSLPKRGWAIASSLRACARAPQQHGQLIRLKRTGRDREPTWAYRYRVGGRDSKRVQRGGFASERDALEALERDLERLRREQRVARSLSLAELGERVPRAARR
jgi:hypothetical protein